VLREGREGDLENYHMKYDLEKERLWFRRQSCAVSS
jgi:hypothetical protein